MNIAVLDDDIELCELLTSFLAGEGFQTRVWNHPERFLEEMPDTACELAILDVMLPGMSGFEVLKRLRAVSDLPVIMLTARGEDVDRIVGLELGADDYLPKPFNPRELAARIRAISRRASRPPHQQLADVEILQIGDIRLDTRSRQVFRNGGELHLTAVEFRLLEVLMRSAGKVIPRQELALQVLERTLSYEDRSLDVHVSNLRRKLGNTTATGERIQTIRGSGYLYALAGDQAAEK